MVDTKQNGHASLFEPLGTSSVIEYGGMISEEWLQELSGQNFNTKIAEMVEGDPVIGGAMFAIEMMLRRADWWVDAASEDALAYEVADFVDGALFRDMRPTWEEVLPEILSFIPYGWCFFETVYKLRHGEGGEAPDDPNRSLFDDGMIGWQAWSIRPQETRYRWEFDDFGRPLALVQVAPPFYVPVLIPLNRGILFRTSSRKGSPEGFPLLRRSFLAYQYRRRLQKLEGIGAERDLAGIPLARVPEKITRASATADERASYETFKTTVRNIKQNTQASLVVPVSYDANNNRLYDVELLKGGGARQFDTNAIINRYGQDIVMSMMAGFLWMGRASLGSYALAQTMTQMFNQAMAAWLDAIASVITNQAIRRLVALNGYPLEAVPLLKHSKVESVDLKDLSLYLTSLAGAGFDLTSDPAILRQLLVSADLPVPAETQEEEAQTDGKAPAVAPGNDDNPDQGTLDEEGQAQ